MKKLLIIVLLSMGFYAHAIQSVDGIWYDPSASGRGATIEVVNGIMLMTYFGYDSQGAATWWQGVANESNRDSGIFTGELNGFKGGQCVGCSFTVSEFNQEGSLGEFTVRFTSDKTATLTWLGGVDQLQRQNYAFPTYEDHLYGHWLFTGFYSFGATIGETATTIYFEFQNDEGVKYLGGNVAGYVGENQRLITATATVFNGIESVAMLVDSSTSYYRMYIINPNENKAFGNYWLYRKDESPTGAGNTAMGVNMFDRYEINAVNAKNGLDKSFNDDIRALVDSKEYEQLQKNSVKAAPETVIDLAESLEQAQLSRKLKQ